MSPKKTQWTELSRPLKKDTGRSWQHSSFAGASGSGAAGCAAASAPEDAEDRKHTNCWALLQMRNGVVAALQLHKGRKFQLMQNFLSLMSVLLALPLTPGYVSVLLEQTTVYPGGAARADDEGAVAP